MNSNTPTEKSRGISSKIVAALKALVIDEKPSSAAESTVHLEGEPMYRYSNKELSILKLDSQKYNGLSHGQVSLLIDEILFLRKVQGFTPESSAETK